MRTTNSLMSVAVALLADAEGEHWGYDLGKRTGLRSGVLYPILRRLLEQDWLEDGWEDPSSTNGRPPRRYYRLTDEGKQELGALAVQAPRLAPSPTSLRLA